MPNNDFYITGGTLPINADSYVLRQADAELLDGLRRGEFCYVLDTRQMGKSSLMVRTARRLREEGSRVIVLDLTAIGQNLTVEQWYFGLLGRAAEQTDQEEELIEAWKARRGRGPMQRFVDAVRHVLLAGSGDAETKARKLILFVDEIDAVRSLPFPADEFFAGIRECYNRRAYDAAFENLTFCLLGVATPGDLIQDTRISPFNIGQRVELHDFTPEEALPLAQGLMVGQEGDLPRTAHARRVLNRVLHWTNGHPYITQRLCQAVAMKMYADTPRSKEESSDEMLVDATCHRLFLTRSARETDDNLTFVASRLLPSEADVSALLDLYTKVRAKKRVADSKTNSLCALLRLSGVVRVDRGLLRMRNRIYEHVFDEAWIRNHLPDAEQRRQKQAYWRGILRATVIGVASVLVVSGLAGIAINRAIVARQFGERAAQQEKLARERLSRLYVDAGVRAMKAGNDGAALSPLVEAMSLDKDDAERMTTYRRRFSAALTRLPQLNHVWFAEKPLTWASLSPDGSYVAAAGEDARVHLWNLKTHEELPVAIHHNGPIRRAAFSPDGTRLVTCGDDACAKVWAVPSGRLLCTLSHPHREDQRDTVLDASWSGDGKKIATASFCLLVVWDVRSAGSSQMNPNTAASAGIHGDNGARVLYQSGPDFTDGANFQGVTFSPDGSRIVLIFPDYRAQVYRASGGRLFSVGKEGIGDCWNAFRTQFSADGKRFLVAGVFDSKSGVGLFDSLTGKTIAFFNQQGDGMVRDTKYCAAFGPGEKQVVSTGDHTARVWDVQTGKPITPPLPHASSVVSAAFSANGRRLVTACGDGTVSVWDAQTGKPICAPVRHAGAVVAAQFVGDERHLLTASQDGTARLWTLPSPIAPEDETGWKHNFFFFLGSNQTLFQDWSAPQSKVVDGPTGGTFFSTARLTVRDADTGAVAASSSDLPPFFLLGLSKDHRRMIINGRKGDAKPGVLDSLRSVQVWDPQRLRPISPQWKASLGALSHNGKLVLLADKGGNWRLVDAVTGAPCIPAWPDTLLPASPVTFRSEMPVFTDYFTPDDRGVVRAENAQTIFVQDTATGVPMTAPLKHEALVTGLVFSPDGRYLFTRTKNATLRVWDVAASALAAAPIPHNLPLGANINGVWFGFSGRYAVTIGQPYAWQWDLNGPLPLHPRRLPLYNTPSLVVSPDGKTFVACDQKDWLWRMDTAESITPPLERSHRIHGAIFSPDSRFVLAVRDDGIARIWDVQDKQPLTPPLEAEQIPLKYAWSADGRYIATLGYGGSRTRPEATVRLWDAQTGDALMFPQPFQGDIYELEFTPDGRYLLAGGSTGLHRWALPITPESLTRLRARSVLLSGQRIDTITGTASVDTTTLRAAWKHLQEPGKSGGR